jgi:hypothetical protein
VARAKEDFLAAMAAASGEAFVRDMARDEKLDCWEVGKRKRRTGWELREGRRIRL